MTKEEDFEKEAAKVLRELWMETDGWIDFKNAYQLEWPTDPSVTFEEVLLYKIALTMLGNAESKSIDKWCEETVSSFESKHRYFVSTEPVEEQLN